MSTNCNIYLSNGDTTYLLGSDSDGLPEYVLPNIARTVPDFSHGAVKVPDPDDLATLTDKLVSEARRVRLTEEGVSADWQPHQFAQQAPADWDYVVEFFPPRVTVYKEGKKTDSRNAINGLYVNAKARVLDTIQLAMDMFSAMNYPVNGEKSSAPIDNEEIQASRILSAVSKEAIDAFNEEHGIMPRLSYSENECRDAAYLAVKEGLVSMEKFKALANTDPFYVDERVGCIGVRMRVDHDISEGLHPDNADVAAFWMGERITGDSGSPEWIVTEEQREAAQARCQELNKSAATEL